MIQLLCVLVSCGDAGVACAVAGRLLGEALGRRDPKDESKWLDVYAHARGHEGGNLVP